MNSFLPIQAKNYLVESLNKRTTKNINLELKEFLKENSLKTLSSQKLQTPNFKSLSTSKFKTTNNKNAEQGGGAGSGGPIIDKPSKNFGDILFGPKTTGFVSKSPELEALGLYALGSGTKIGSDFLQNFGAQGVGSFLSPFLGKTVAGYAGSGLTGLLTKGLDQVTKITGKDWFDAQIGDIGASAERRAAEGAGRPFTELIIPGSRNRTITPYDKDKEFKEKIAQAQNARQIDKLKKQGYLP